MEKTVDVFSLVQAIYVVGKFSDSLSCSDFQFEGWYLLCSSCLDSLWLTMIFHHFHH